MTKKLTPSFRLTQSLTEVDKKELESLYKQASRVIERILELSDKELNKNLKESESPEAFKNNDWALHQSYNFGYRQGIRQVMNILRKSDNDL